MARALQQFIVEGAQPVASVSGVGGMGVNQHHVLAIEPQIDVLQIAQRPDKEPRAHQQRQRQSGLPRYQNLAEPYARSRRRRAALPGGLRQVHASDAQGGRQAEKNTRQQRQPGGERRQREAGLQAQVGIDEMRRRDGRDAPARQRESGGSAHGGQNQALGEQLADQPRSPGPHRQADRDLLAASGGARQQQI